MTDDDGFRLSRVQAQGWNAAHRVLASGSGSPNDAKIGKLNPHRADPERARWRAGFESALEAAAAK